MDDFILNVAVNKPRKKIEQQSEVPKIPSSLRKTDAPIKKPSIIEPIKTNKKPSSKVEFNKKSNVTSKLHQKFTKDPPKETSRSKTIDARKSEKPVNNLVSLLSEPVKPRIESVFSSHSWSDFATRHNLHKYLTTCLTDRFKLSQVTAIQSIAIPTLLDASNDALVRAQTGSGKTLAYAIPLFQQLISINPPVDRSNGPLALIVLPTRELALQTADVLTTLGKASVRLVTGCLVSGMKRKSQKSSLRKGINIVVGSPQRILDHIGRTSSLDLSRITFLAIDEADRLMELGFERDIRQIIDHIRSVRQVESRLQTVLLSATLTSGVEKLAGLALNKPVNCVVDDADSNSQDLSASFSLPAGLKHFSLVVPWKAKLLHLTAFLLLKCRYRRKAGKVVVFMATQACVDYHYNLFQSVLCPDDESCIIPRFAGKLDLFRLHGSMEHKERQTEFTSFVASKSGILLTTDVASRGLDLPSVSWVVQYHLTGRLVDYVHRVGRTARAGGRGKSLIVLDPNETSFLDLITSRLSGSQFEPIDSSQLMQTTAFHLTHTSTKRRGRSKTTVSLSEGVARFSRLFFDAVNGDDALRCQAQSAYTSFVRSYAAMGQELRACFPFRQLHLGHVAHAFCLSMSPSQVAANVLQSSKRHRDNKSGDGGEGRRRRSAAANLHNKSATDGGKRRASTDEFGFNNNKRPRLSSTGGGKPEEMARQNMLAEFGL